MGAYYDEIEIEDMVWDDEKRVYHYPCPCGDRFEISKRQLADCEDIATCPSCSLIIRVIYDPVRFVLFFCYGFFDFLNVIGIWYSSILRMSLRMMMILEWRKQKRTPSQRTRTRRRRMILSKMLWSR